MTLPTEMWLDIISHVKRDTDDHVYKAVYPVEIQAAQTEDSNPEPSLICNNIEKGLPCGDLDSVDGIRKFNEYLDNPLAKEEERQMWRPETTPPFKILDATKDPIYSISLRHLETDIEFLFHKITVPDIISRFENGKCNLCDSERVIHSYGMLFMTGSSFFTLTPTGHLVCQADALCPLCIGFDYIDMCFVKRCPCLLDAEERMPDDEYYICVEARFREFGYGPP